MLLRFSAFLSVLSFGAIFGFFYAWVCSTMWGLDQIDPRAAITAMQGMNASVRNGIFALSFFGTPLYAAGVAALAWRAGARDVAIGFACAGAFYVAGGMILTMTLNVPMNEALALFTDSLSLKDATEIWNAYSPEWQVYNQIRTVISGAGLMLAVWGLYRLGGHGKDMPIQ